MVVSTTIGGASNLLGSSFSATQSVMTKDFEVPSPPDDSISCMAFSPAAIPQNFLIAGSWNNHVCCWEIDQSGMSIPKSQQTMQGPVLDVSWTDDGTKVFMAGCDKTVKYWDLCTNQSIQVAAHDAPVKTCHWVRSPTCSFLMTGSWDRTLKFWDLRTPNPVLTLALPERAYCADVDYPFAVVSTAGHQLIVYQLQGIPSEYKRIDSPLKYQHRCVSIFRDKNNHPTGFALGSIGGRVAIQYINPPNHKDNFTFRCHYSDSTNQAYQDVYAVNDIKFHPVHGTLATVGSDGRFSFWNKDSRTIVKTSEQMEQSITACCFNRDGQIFAYSVSYDWSKGHEFNNIHKKNRIFLHSYH